jgi:hypothetical protein
MRDGKLVWEPRGAWKHVVTTGFFTPRHSSPPAAIGEPVSTFPSVCPNPGAARTVRENIVEFFKDNPAWE